MFTFLTAGATVAFWTFNNENQGIDGYYVTGVSLTHGDACSQQHIWTFAAGLSEVHECNSRNIA